jgi:hypothetical protein
MDATSRLVATFLLNCTWQLTLIIAVAWLACRMARGAASRHCHRFWVASLALSALLPLSSALCGKVGRAEGSGWTLPRLSPATEKGAPVLAPVSAPRFWLGTSIRLPGRAVLVDRFWLRSVLGLYSLFLLWHGVRLVRAWLRTEKLRTTAYVPDLPPAVASILGRCASALEIGPVRVLCSPLAPGPLTLGLRRATIIVPAALLETATLEDWSAAVSHEMAHIRRNDFLGNLVCEGLYCLIAFHPLAPFLRRQIKRTRELACDEMATRRLVGPVDYARALLRIAGMVSSPTAMPRADCGMGVFDANFLEERVMRLLNRDLVPALWLRGSLLLGFFLLAASFISASVFAVAVGQQEKATVQRSDASFAGTWKGTRNGVTIAILRLWMENKRLAGTMSSVRINGIDEKGEITSAGEASGEEAITDLRVERGTVEFTETDAPEEPLRFSFTLRTESEGALRLLNAPPPGIPALRPITMIKEAPTCP